MVGVFGIHRRERRNSCCVLHAPQTFAPVVTPSALSSLGGAESPPSWCHASPTPTPCPNFPAHALRHLDSTILPPHHQLQSSPVPCLQSCVLFMFSLRPSTHKLQGPSLESLPCTCSSLPTAASSLLLRCTRLVNRLPAGSATAPSQWKTLGNDTAVTHMSPHSRCRQSHRTSLEYLLSHFPKCHFTPSPLFSNHIKAGNPTSVPLGPLCPELLSFFIWTVEIASN